MIANCLFWLIDLTKACRAGTRPVCRMHGWGGGDSLRLVRPSTCSGRTRSG